MLNLQTLCIFVCSFVKSKSWNLTLINPGIKTNIGQQTFYKKIEQVNPKDQGVFTKKRITLVKQQNTSFFSLSLSLSFLQVRAQTALFN